MDYKICHVYSAEILYESFSGIYTRRLFIDWKQIISSFNTSTGLTSKHTFSLCSQRWGFLVKVLAHLRQMGAPVLVLHVCADATWSMSFDSISSCRWTMGSPPCALHHMCIKQSFVLNRFPQWEWSAWSGAELDKREIWSVNFFMIL